MGIIQSSKSLTAWHKSSIILTAWHILPGMLHELRYSTRISTITYGEREVGGRSTILLVRYEDASCQFGYTSTDRLVRSYVDDETERHMETATVVTVCLHCIRYDSCAILYSCGTVRVRVLSMRCGLLTRSYGYYGFVTYGYRFVFVSRRYFTCGFRRHQSPDLKPFEASACLG